MICGATGTGKTSLLKDLIVANGALRRVVYTKSQTDGLDLIVNTNYLDLNVANWHLSRGRLIPQAVFVDTTQWDMSALEALAAKCAVVVTMTRVRPGLVPNTDLIPESYQGPEKILRTSKFQGQFRVRLNPRPSIVFGCEDDGVYPRTTRLDWLMSDA